MPWTVRGLVVLLLLAAALAGCSGTPSEATEPESSSSEVPDQGAASPRVNATVQPPTLPTLGFTDCRNQGGVFAMPRAAAVAALPDGFEPVENTRAGAPPDSVVLYGISVDCQGSAIDGVAGNAVRFAYAELAVTPPDDQQVDGLTDCTVPLAFIITDEAIGAILQSYGLGAAGSGSLSETAAEPNGSGGSLQSFELQGGGSMQFIFGAAAVDTLSVGTGDFALYGVQDKQVVSVVHGTSSGADAAAHYSTAMFQSTGILALEGVQDGAVGFAASGFDLGFAPLPVPAMA